MRANATGTTDGPTRRPGRRTRRGSWLAAAGLLVSAVVGVGTQQAGAAPGPSAPWNGNGVSVDTEGNASLDHEVCGTENGAPVDGTYLQWVLVAKQVTSATLVIGADDPVDMARNGNNGTFQYIQTDFDDLADIVDGGATARYVGKADPKAKVVLGSGCYRIVKSYFKK